jgi:hypothetical protein
MDNERSQAFARGELNRVKRRKEELRKETSGF